MLIANQTAFFKEKKKKATKKNTEDTTANDEQTCSLLNGIIITLIVVTQMTSRLLDTALTRWENKQALNARSSDQISLTFQL